MKHQGQDFYVSMVKSGFCTDSDFLFSCASDASTEPRGSGSLQQEADLARRAKKGSKNPKGKGARSSSAVLRSQTRFLNGGSGRLIQYVGLTYLHFSFTAAL